MYFPLGFAQEYFTLITRGQSLLHLPINMYCELSRSCSGFRIKTGIISELAQELAKNARAKYLDGMLTADVVMTLVPDLSKQTA